MKRYFNGKSPNIKWKLGENIGKNFEDFIADMIKMQLKDSHPQITVTQTNYIGDGGKDIIVTSELDCFSVLGQKFVSSGKKRFSIYFECKSTDDDVLRFDKISASYSRAQFQDIDYYVLVTNSEILPQACWYISEELNSRGIKFILIDSFLLGKEINKLPIENALNNPYKKSKETDFYYEYQVEPFAPQYKNKYNIYLLFRNYSNTSKHCTLKLKTDIDWDVSNDSISFIISSRGFVVKKITVEQNHFDGIPELLFNVKINDTESTVMIRGIQGLQIFEPPFFGDSRKELVNKLNKDLKSSKNPNIICLWGDAGIGKTRLVKELLVKLQGTYFDFFDCKMQKGRSPEKDIKKFLFKNNYISNKEYKDFFSMLVDCNNAFGKTPIIVLDDFHNASKDFMGQIKRIGSLSIKAILIICGRTDFSVGDINYLSFISWTKKSIPKYCFEIEPLTDDETKRFIKTLIDGIPNYALERLFDLSMKNPLFIVQYIEYLLDCNLVRLKNRNTVGIVDINKFHSKKYIPKGISDIYKLRINNLLEQSQGESCLHLMYKLALCNGNLSSDVFYSFFANEQDYLSKLLRRRLLKFDQNGNIIFIHESFYLYIKNHFESNKKTCKCIATELLEKIDLSLVLNDLQIGKIYLYAKKYKEAKIRFASIEKWIESTDNISNINVNIDYYEYLFDIFELFARKNNDLDISKRALLMRVYITLHHFAPINAVNECDNVLKRIKKYKHLDDKMFQLSITELKAHALMNSGLYTDGETLLKEIQVQWICDKSILNHETLFDLYDRLTSVYRHFNLKDLAIKYNMLSLELANNLQDAKLQMLANRTKYKLYLYMDRCICEESLNESIALNQIVPSNRIKTDNDLDLCGMRILNNETEEWDSIIKDIQVLLEYAENNNFNRAKIHGYFLLSICNLLKNTKSSISVAKEYVDKAVDLSTFYGIVGYLWRLYNLNAIIEMRLNYNDEQIYKSFLTVFEILKNRGLLYIGNRDLCHGNILALSNIGFYLQEHKFESEFYEKMSLVSYTDKNRYASIRNESSKNPVHIFLVEQYNRAKNKHILFTSTEQNNLLRDSQTNYFIIL